MKLISHYTYPDWGREIMLMEQCGYAFARIYMYKNDDTAYIESLSVNVEVRHKGFGSQLMKQIEQIAFNTLGVSILGLCVDEESWMHGWYERLGYVDHGWDKGDDCMIWMLKPLNNS